MQKSVIHDTRRSKTPAWGKLPRNHQSAGSLQTKHVEVVEQLDRRHSAADTRRSGFSSFPTSHARKPQEAGSIVGEVPILALSSGI